MQHVNMSTCNPTNIRPPVLAILASSPLSATRQKGERLREQWLADLAAKSLLNTWSIEQIEAETARGAAEALGAGNVRTTGSAYEIAREGRLAAHPKVRARFHYLLAMRDRIWAARPELVRAVIHGPSQLLVDMLVAQKKAHLRHHVASDGAYIQHLEDRLLARQYGQRGHR